jgi:predicted alpha/beta-hydrolase family hydrolase
LAKTARPGIVREVPPPIYLAPGASGSVAALRPQITGLGRRGLTACGVTLPRGAAERAVVAYRAAVPEPAVAVIGGHSFGGRVASLLAADETVAGLLLLSYPLHRPGHPETWEQRTAHWERIGCPVLLLSGESDPFARIDLLRSAVRRLRHAELVTYPRVRHGIGPVLEEALDRVAAWASTLAG